jgi:hypothetical protein
MVAACSATPSVGSHIRCNHRSSGRRDSEPNRSGVSPGDNPNRLARLRGEIEDHLGTPQELRPGLGERDASCGPREQRRAELELEPAEELAHRGRAHVQTVCRTGKVQFPRGGGERAQLAKLHSQRPTAASITT